MPGFGNVFLVCVLNGRQLRQFLIPVAAEIRFVANITHVCRFWTEQEHEDELKDQEDLEHVEQPKPAEALEDLATDDGCETRRRIEDEIDEGDAETSLVHEIHVSDSGDDERFESRC